jgi:hypothetical protein
MKCGMICLEVMKKNNMQQNKVMNIGQMTISEAYHHLQPIANAYGLRLNRAKEFKLARMLLVNLYNREL